MSQANEVVLRVRAYGQQGIEFSLYVLDSDERRWILTWWLIVILCLISGWVLKSVELGVSSPFRVLLGLLLPALAVWLYQVSGSVIVEESMLVVPALGVKLSTRRRSGVVHSKFVDLETISGVAVNEAITFSSVVYSLVLMVEGQSEMVLPFQTFRPRVAVLQEVYLETVRLLFPDGTDLNMRLPEGVAPP
ncbi:phosphatidylinositol n-acetylglucosaminyltransferase subunit h [Plasmopara halstedii]|uniref:Phosphatidylinositol n-acetylglucosaminyltransferase subunit h n=1 Tax=Plasmopara halstedii TaxID=4781 RepID=A0A0P1AJT7_PLAHL|nr:phosphatidylinositol n-acetylglucosaminyltransferase subunit h [Plasmopara halstedii]CEG40788.1 phosphatidylinositol n-acetylglucosaminyltransferase subunit h [Plasmopara halstedii]|eukprot:XP_024577157.1 phosphatidylinositol n-acetylglucosaminyltransferase subunit h [Plasmopara halstedii]